MSEARCDPSPRVCVEKAREFCPVETRTVAAVVEQVRVEVQREPARCRRWWNATGWGDERRSFFLERRFMSYEKTQ